MHCSRTFVRHADYKIIDKELGCSKRALYSCSAIYENDVWVETHLSYSKYFVLSSCQDIMRRKLCIITLT